MALEFLMDLLQHRRDLRAVGKVAGPLLQQTTHPVHLLGDRLLHEVSILSILLGKSTLTIFSIAPAWNASANGARTPSWKLEGSRTSNPYDAGHKTALGSRTPAWAAGSKTPREVSSGYGGSSSGSGFDAFLAGSRTPAPGAFAGSRTPAWGHSSGSSSKAFDAPTPGGDYAAPSPAAFGAAPTPGASAPTPRAWNDAAPTPGAINAPTPGASAYHSAPTPASGVPDTPGAMDYGGPRYEEGTPSP